MAEVIRMPLLSDTMKEGVIAEWHKKVGDKVKSDDVLAEVETDKATMEVMPYVDGTLLYVGVETGKAAAVNGIMAIIGKEGEEFKRLLDVESTRKKEKSSTNSAAETPAATSKQATKGKKKAPLSPDVTVVRMPLLSDTMKEGKLVSWLKNEGDQVKSDDVLAEVETDKATMEVMGYADGTLLYIGVPAGEAAKVNEIIAIVGPAGTDIAPYLEEEGEEEASEENPEEKVVAQKKSEPAATTNEDTDEDDNRIKISPLARKIAKEKGIKLNELSGTGDGGRIIKRDVDSYQPKAVAAGANVPKEAVLLGQESYTDKPLSQMQSVVARRLGESKFSAPHFYLRITIKMDNAIAARKAMNEDSTVKISFNDYIIKAYAMA